MKQSSELKKILGEGEEQCDALLTQTLFTVAYYNALGYYPTSFFVWKNLVDIKGSGIKSSFKNIITILDRLLDENKIIEQNGMYKLVKSQKSKVKSFIWYKEQIQKNKISTDKIKRMRRWASVSRWVPYLRGLFLTGTLAIKRGGTGSDWDVLVVLKKDRIWIGRLILTSWFHLIKKRRNKQKIQNRFCLNQFVISNKMVFKEQNEFFGNELLMAEELMGNVPLQNKIIQKNRSWLKKFKPNFEIRELRGCDSSSSLFGGIQRFLEFSLEKISFAKVINAVSKKMMIKRILNNPKTYAEGADIRYGDFSLVFLPCPQRAVIKRKTRDLLTKMNL